MKYLILIIAGIVFCSGVYAQQQDPVHFTFMAQKTADKNYLIHFTATVDEGWHIYAQVQPKTAVAEPTRIVFTKNPLITVVGKPKETGKLEKQKLEEVDIEQDYYAGKVEFIQQIKLKAAVKTNVSGTITYQACTEEMCLPPKTVSFSIPVQ